MGVFTIFNCGTSYDEFSGDLIAEAYALAEGERGKQKLITAGPGSPLGKKVGYDPAKNPPDYRREKSLEALLNEGVNLVTGALSGVNHVHYNVKRVLQILKGLPNPKPYMVNMAGWSRGACTCHAIANAMRRDKDGWLHSVPVNIFAIDPVPGTGNLHINDWTCIPSNVTNYMAIFMEDEHRDIMYAAELTFESPGTSKTLTNLPGKHWFAVEADKEVVEAGLEEVVDVGGHLCRNFLETWGTTFTGTALRRSDLQLVEDYSLMIKHTLNFYENGKSSLGDVYRFTGNNLAWFKVTNHYLSDQPYWVNAHHQQVFKSVAPKLYRYCFFTKDNKPVKFREDRRSEWWKMGEIKAAQNRELDAFDAEWKGLKGKAPHTYDTLNDYGSYYSGVRKMKQDRMAPNYDVKDSGWNRKAS
jgi:hypothetical protein